MEAYKERFETIESTENVRILGGFSIGSRNWGYNVEDSDHDLRFIYTRDIFDYVRLDEKEKNISYPIENKYDIQGWDIGRFLSMVAKHNVIVCESLFSTLEYGDSEYISRLKEYVNKHFVYDKYIIQYVNLLEKELSRLKNLQEIPVKSLIFCLRLVCMMNYLKEFNEFPKCTFSQLFLARDNKSIEIAINNLITYRRNGNEYLSDSSVVMTFLEENCKKYKKSIDYTNKENVNIEELNSLLYDGVSLFNSNKKTL
ncbi:MAG: DNA polymerase beta superfamily protein [Bacilli bacterium]